MHTHESPNHSKQIHLGQKTAGDYNNTLWQFNVRCKELGTAPHWYHRSNFRGNAMQFSICAGIQPRGCKPAFWPWSSSNFFHTGQNNKTYDFNVSLGIESLLLPEPVIRGRMLVRNWIRWQSASLPNQWLHTWNTGGSRELWPHTEPAHLAWMIWRHLSLWSHGCRPCCNLKCSCQI